MNVEDKEQLLDDWLKAQSNMQFYKKLEADLRMQVAWAFNIDKLVEGTNHRQTDNYAVKITKRFHYGLDEEILDEIWDDLSDEEQSVIKTRRTLSKSGYRDLLDCSVLDDAITVKDSIPTISAYKLEN